MDILLVQPLKGLIEPGNYVRSCYVEPLGLQYLTSFLNSKGYEVKLIHPIMSNKEFNKIIKEYEPRIIGFSVYSYSLDQALKWANITKDYNKRIITVFGGYHPSAKPEIVKNPNIDYVVIGEGEYTMEKLCDFIIKNRGETRKIKGITYTSGNNIRINPNPDRINDLDSLPFPYRDRKLMKDTKSYQISYPTVSEQRAFTQVICSRGCPFNCKYCLSTRIWGKKVKWRSPKNIADEMEYLNDKFGTNLIYFPDLSFNSNKNKVIELCKELITRDLPVHWWPLCRIDKMDENLMGYLKKAKCVKLTFGLECFDINVAHRIKGAYRISWDRIENILEIASSMGFITRGFFMLGIPAVPENYYESASNKLKGLALDEIRLSFYTPFPGTRLFNECKEKRLIKKDINYSKLTTDEPVIKTKYSKKELIKFRESIYSGFYTSEEYKKRVRRKIKNYPHLKKSFIESYRYMLNNNLLKGEFRRKFSEFLSEISDLKVSVSLISSNISK